MTSLAILAPVIAVAGLLAYFVVSTKLALYRRVPWEFLAVTALGAALGVYALYLRPALGTAVSALLSASVLGFASWYLLRYSMFGRREDRPGVGEIFPDFTLTLSTGEAFRLDATTGKRHLIILYRGDW